MVFVTWCLHEWSINPLDCLCRRGVVSISLTGIFSSRWLYHWKKKLFNVKTKYGSTFPKSPCKCKAVELCAKYLALWDFHRGYNDLCQGSTEKTFPKANIPLESLQICLSDSKQGKSPSILTALQLTTLLYCVPTDLKSMTSVSRPFVSQESRKCHLNTGLLSLGTGDIEAGSFLIERAALCILRCFTVSLLSVTFSHNNQECRGSDWKFKNTA